jgi:Reverse transcriptase (RNA-dependent DNA polymerase)
LRQLHVLDKNESSHDRLWDCNKVLKYSEERTVDDDVDHRCLVEWNDLNKSQSWVNFFALYLSNPTPITSFAKEHQLLEKSPFCHLIPYCKAKPSLNISKSCTVSSSPTTVKYKFGIQVPRGIRNAISLDKKNKNNLWQQAIDTELKQLTDYETFIVLDSGEDIPREYQKIPYHIVFDVKYDLRHKARLVAGGNWTVNDKEDIYSGVVRMDTIRIGFFLGELYGLSCCACDIGNEFLYGKTKEKVYITAGPEFGSTLCGKNLIINKSLYGLKTSAARFHEHLAESLLRLGFVKTKHDNDLWMIDKISHYEYLATYVDDILVWSKDPMGVIKSLEKIYVLKSVGIPEYYLGGNVEILGDAWKSHGLGLAISAKTYIQNVIPKFESLFGKELKPVKTPMSEGYHPEVDNTPLCTDEDSAKYRSIIGCCIWIIVLGRFDIAYATSAMSRFNMAPREGHLKAVKRILAYLKTFPKGTVIIDTSYPNHSEYLVDDLPNWKDFYPDAEEEIPTDLPKSKGPKVQMTVYVDADHAHDLVTRRSITGILVMLNNTPIRWVSKHQNTVETSTYGSELIASRIATELIIEIRFMFRSLGVDLGGPALMLGDNMSVVLNTSVPSSVLKKKHNSIAYRRVREAIAAKILSFA